VNEANAVRRGRTRVLLVLRYPTAAGFPLLGQGLTGDPLPEAPL
jgi:hypothetical protein